MKNDDGHNPETCNYYQCRAQVATVCPFMGDAKTQTVMACKHEWRGLSGIVQNKLTFYCIYCKNVEQKPITT